MVSSADFCARLKARLRCNIEPLVSVTLRSRNSTGLGSLKRLPVLQRRSVGVRAASLAAYGFDLGIGWTRAHRFACLRSSRF
jgi:hypothetical protein